MKAAPGGGWVQEEGGRAALDAHLSDGEAVAKMGHPEVFRAGRKVWVERCERYGRWGWYRDPSLCSG
jgi:hypothetical protein